MCFLGNPGSGKTEVARLIAGILYENKILPTNKIIEVDRSGLVSQYFGATAEKTSRVIARAMGGVLFIDEAYALGNNNDAGSITDYGREAIDTLVRPWKTIAESSVSYLPDTGMKCSRCCPLTLAQVQNTVYARFSKLFTG